METLKYWFFDPRESHLFIKTTSKDRVEFREVQCSAKARCSLFGRGECILVDAFSRCFYGKKTLEQGPTKKSKSINAWIEERKLKFKDIKNLSLKYPNKKMAVIGDYIYLPYSHITMNKEVPYLEYSGFFNSGLPFIHKDNFTVENIIKIINFRPQSLMGGEIFSYQSEEVPKILIHLREEFPNLYDNILDLRPDYIVKYNLTQKKNVGRKAYLKTLNSPIKYTTNGSREGQYRVEWEWDGKVLRTSSEHAYNSIWGDFKDIQNLNIEIIPNDSAAIIVQSESWVNKDTCFLD